MTGGGGGDKAPKETWIFFFSTGMWWKECWASWLDSDPGSTLGWLDIPPGSFLISGGRALRLLTQIASNSGTPTGSESPRRVYFLESWVVHERRQACPTARRAGRTPGVGGTPTFDLQEIISPS